MTVIVAPRVGAAFDSIAIALGAGGDRLRFDGDHHGVGGNRVGHDRDRSECGCRLCSR